ncbi:MAG: relaxase/mobilization nuclease domain-containing protein, partial [Ruminococcus sp.]|nr:relaxase/mobilization nuclease domain-containing protein [Ruminococcus sp.]
MAIIKAVSSKSLIKTAIAYVIKEEKTNKKLLSGYNLTSPETAYDEMQITKEIWNKTNGRTYKHYVQSFAPDEEITPEQVHAIA